MAGELVRVWTDVGARKPVPLLAKIEEKDGVIYTIRYLSEDPDHVWRYEEDTYDIDEDSIAEYLKTTHEEDVGFKIHGDDGFVKVDTDDDYVPDEDDEDETESDYSEEDDEFDEEEDPLTDEEDDEDEEEETLDEE
jgi:predicted dehydrogenase